MSALTRREWLAGAGALAGAARAAQKRPNILFLMVDEMRWDAMGCEGHPLVRTPNLDRLARQGSRFANCYTVSPVCSPSRASVFTGRYTHVHGVEMNGIPAHPGEIFLPTILRHYGYHTAISGKLHYTPKPFAYGFDQFWTFSNEGPKPELGYAAYLKRKYGSPARFPRKPGTCPWPDDPLGRDVGLFRYPREDFEAEWITRHALDYLRSRKGDPQPWFLFTSYLKPHSPSVEPEPYFSMYDPASIQPPKLPPNAREIRAAQRDRAKRHYVDDERMVRVMSAKYYGAITHIDHLIGNLLAELDRLGMANNTLVLFTADHGNMLGDHGRWFKGVQYEGSAHIPLLWKWPEGDPRNDGRVVDQVVENTDLMPSLLEAVGLPVPDGVQGRSFLKLARGQDPDWKSSCFSQLNAGMVMHESWKLIDNSRNGTGPFELYDLRNDPKEERNLADDPKQRDRVAHYRAELARWRAERPAPIRVPGLSTPAYAQITEEERQKAIPKARRDATRLRRQRPAATR